jgi:predicted PhzF superfamily epimerase YddE/YHI9
MKLLVFQVDAFTSRVFGGNPAAVVPLEHWLDDAVLQSIAAENNLSETAFLVGGDGRYRIRWMTPTSEVDLCGHATLASAWVVFQRLEPGRREVSFASNSGQLRVAAEGDKPPSEWPDRLPGDKPPSEWPDRLPGDKPPSEWPGRLPGDKLALDFPSRPPEAADASLGAVAQALGREPLAVLASRDYLALFECEDDVRALRPDMARIAALDRMAVIVTARGSDCDFVSRFFAPSVGVPEDPVTGSAHCTLVPFWAARLGETRLFARQLSARGGELWCELRGERVSIAGHAALYLEGTIEV